MTQFDINKNYNFFKIKKYSYKKLYENKTINKLIFFILKVFPYFLIQY